MLSFIYIGMSVCISVRCCLYGKMVLPAILTSKPKATLTSINAIAAGMVPSCSSHHKKDIKPIFRLLQTTWQIIHYSKNPDVIQGEKKILNSVVILDIQPFFTFFGHGSRYEMRRRVNWTQNSRSDSPMVHWLFDKRDN